MKLKHRHCREEERQKVTEKASEMEAESVGALGQEGSVSRPLRTDMVGLVDTLPLPGCWPPGAAAASRPSSVRERALPPPGSPRALTLGSLCSGFELVCSPLAWEPQKPERSLTATAHEPCPEPFGNCVLKDRVPTTTLRPGSGPPGQGQLEASRMGDGLCTQQQT